MWGQVRDWRRQVFVRLVLLSQPGGRRASCFTPAVPHPCARMLLASLFCVCRCVAIKALRVVCGTSDPLRSVWVGSGFSPAYMAHGACDGTNVFSLVGWCRRRVCPVLCVVAVVVMMKGVSL